MTEIKNPVGYFEIPVVDLDRALDFYKKVFGFDFVIEEVDGYQMAMFPFDSSKPGITGALVKGDVYIPVEKGVIIYFNSDDIEVTLKRVLEAGGSVLYPKTSVGVYGFVAEFKDSEGNRIALTQQ